MGANCERMQDIFNLSTPHFIFISYRVENTHKTLENKKKDRKKNRGNKILLAYTQHINIIIGYYVIFGK